MICESGDHHLGVGEEFPYLLDLNWKDPKTGWPNQIFFSVPDSLGGCVAVYGYGYCY